VELIPHMLDQVRLKVQKYQSRSQMRLPLKNGCETSRCLVIIVAVVSLVVDDHIVQDDASTHDQIENALRVRPVRDG
jgi:hypothetical protein